MEALSALAIVAQKAIPPCGREAAQKAILQAELERTRLDLQRTLLYYRDAHRCVHLLSDEVTDLKDDIENLEGLSDDLDIENRQLKDLTAFQKYQIKGRDHQIESLRQELLQERPLLEHNVPSDTEVNDRRKFLKLFMQ